MHQGEAGRIQDSKCTAAMMTVMMTVNNTIAASVITTLSGSGCLLYNARRVESACMLVMAECEGMEVLSELVRSLISVVYYSIMYINRKA